MKLYLLDSVAVMLKRQVKYILLNRWDGLGNKLMAIL
jgi:hypothetical protein